MTRIGGDGSDELVHGLRIVEVALDGIDSGCAEFGEFLLGAREVRGTAGDMSAVRRAE